MRDIEQINSLLYTNIMHHTLILKGLRALHSILCPIAYPESVLHYQMKETNAKHIQQKSYWRRKIVSVKQDAIALISIWTPEDERTYGLTAFEIIELLEDKFMIKQT